MRTIQLREAKAGLPQVVDEAMDGEPSLITRVDADSIPASPRC
jgi:antitoxin (DNA-binding transcriptional repressor) of toxin-antitoxin stability system